MDVMMILLVAWLATKKQVVDLAYRGKRAEPPSITELRERNAARAKRRAGKGRGKFGTWWDAYTDHKIKKAAEKSRIKTQGMLDAYREMAPQLTEEEKQKHLRKLRKRQKRLDNVFGQTDAGLAATSTGAGGKIEIPTIPTPGGVPANADALKAAAEANKPLSPEERERLRAEIEAEISEEDEAAERNARHNEEQAIREAREEAARLREQEAEEELRRRREQEQARRAAAMREQAEEARRRREQEEDEKEQQRWREYKRRRDEEDRERWQRLRREEVAADKQRAEEYRAQQEQTEQTEQSDPPPIVKAHAERMDHPDTDPEDATESGPRQLDAAPKLLPAGASGEEHHNDNSRGGTVSDTHYVDAVDELTEIHEEAVTLLEELVDFINELANKGWGEGITSQLATAEELFNEGNTLLEEEINEIDSGGSEVSDAYDEAPDIPDKSTALAV